MTSTKSFDALGTVWYIEANIDPALLEECQDIALAFQHRYSRFEADSELTRLNNHGRLLDPPLEMVKMVNFAAAAHKATGGLFNITAGAALASKGYGSINKGRLIPEWTVGLIAEENKIELPEGVKLDFGGFGKGWLIDSLHDHLIGLGATHIIVNGGGDIRVSTDELVTIPLMMPGDKTKKFAECRIKKGSLASSSPLVRSWGSKNHLVSQGGSSYDGDIEQLTVYVELALEADMAATACILSEHPFNMATKLNVGLLTAVKDRYQHTSEFPIKSQAN